ncbi:carbon storage regulator CsrA [Inediibacterium massiliense]|uniref:carbon storage regulator CsrA n=1 Tax=Inediibacterium massiliense TaxID=1658111 RepID=UPI0006B46F33|nr:carbon storage regulator CsrA [Inediibacterium massiliense]
MLILSRKKDESIIIDHKMEIKVISIEDGKVRLGINAPKEIDIYRKEVYIEIEEENKKAAIGKLDFEGIKNLFNKK